MPVRRTPKRALAGTRAVAGAKFGAYFSSLSVENIRCFGPKQVLKLINSRGHPTQWTLLIGDNGTGKTTLLQALAFCQPVTIDRMRHNRSIHSVVPRLFIEEVWKNYFIHQSFVRDTQGEISVTIRPRDKLDASGPEASDGNDIDIGWIIQSLGRTWNASGPMVHGESVSDHLRLSCYSYGSSRRTGVTSLSDEDSWKGNATLFDDDAQLRNPEEWLIRADYVATKQQPQDRTKLNEIKKILINLLPDVDDIRLYSSADDLSVIGAEFHTPYGWVPFKGLGRGYKTVVTWIIDFASRLFERYPKSKNPLREPAICLVDEIDLHLHPKWQRSIMTYLSQIFPSTQFIATAHSPLIVQSLPEANIAVLRREEDHIVIDQSIGSIRGWRIDQVLTSDLFGLESARPPKLEPLLKERTAILSKPELSRRDKSRLKQLETKIGDLPTAENPADIEAMEIIRRAADRLKQNS